MPILDKERWAHLMGITEKGESAGPQSLTHGCSQCCATKGQTQVTLRSTKGRRCWQLRHHHKGMVFREKPPAHKTPMPIRGARHKVTLGIAINKDI